MNFKTRIRELFQQPIKPPVIGGGIRGTETQCPGCGRKTPFRDFHRIPDMAALKSFQSSSTRESATSGSFYVPGRFASGEQYGSFVYCEECDKRLSMAEKKVLIWHLCAHSPARDKSDALRRLDRGRHLCAQIDKGL